MRDELAFAFEAANRIELLVNGRNSVTAALAQLPAEQYEIGEIRAIQRLGHGRVRDMKSYLIQITEK